MNTFKMTALGALATVGLATTAVAQSKVDHRLISTTGSESFTMALHQHSSNFA